MIETQHAREKDFVSRLLAGYFSPVESGCGGNTGVTRILEGENGSHFLPLNVLLVTFRGQKVQVTV